MQFGTGDASRKGRQGRKGRRREMVPWTAENSLSGEWFMAVFLYLFCLLSPLPARPAAAPNLTTAHPLEETNLVLHNPDMGWILYENYPLDQQPGGSSTMLALPNEPSQMSTPSP